MNTTWTIAQLNRETAGGLVTVAHWRLEAVDGEGGNFRKPNCNVERK